MASYLEIYNKQLEGYLLFRDDFLKAQSPKINEFLKDSSEVIKRIMQYRKKSGINIDDFEKQNKIVFDDLSANLRYRIKPISPQATSIIEGSVFPAKIFQGTGQRNFRWDPHTNYADNFEHREKGPSMLLKFDGSNWTQENPNFSVTHSNSPACKVEDKKAYKSSLSDALDKISPMIKSLLKEALIRQPKRVSKRQRTALAKEIDDRYFYIPTQGSINIFQEFLDTVNDVWFPVPGAIPPDESKILRDYDIAKETLTLNYAKFSGVFTEDERKGMLNVLDALEKIGEHFVNQSL